MALSASSARKRLTGNGAGPHGSVVGPTGEPESETPAGDAGEEVALLVPRKVIGRHVLDRAVVHIAGRDVTGGNEVPQPLDTERVDLVVVGGHSSTLIQSDPSREGGAVSPAVTPGSGGVPFNVGLIGPVDPRSSGALPVLR